MSIHSVSNLNKTSLLFIPPMIWKDDKMNLYGYWMSELIKNVLSSLPQNDVLSKKFSDSLNTCGYKFIDSLKKEGPCVKGEADFHNQYYSFKTLFGGLYGPDMPKEVQIAIDQIRYYLTNTSEIKDSEQIIKDKLFIHDIIQKFISNSDASNSTQLYLHPNPETKNETMNNDQSRDIFIIHYIYEEICSNIVANVYYTSNFLKNTFDHKGTKLIATWFKTRLDLDNVIPNNENVSTGADTNTPTPSSPIPKSIFSSFDYIDMYGVMRRLYFDNPDIEFYIHAYNMYCVLKSKMSVVYESIYLDYARVNKTLSDLFGYTMKGQNPYHSHTGDKDDINNLYSYISNKKFIDYGRQSNIPNEDDASQKIRFDTLMNIYNTTMSSCTEKINTILFILEQCRWLLFYIQKKIKSLHSINVMGKIDGVNIRWYTESHISPNNAWNVYISLCPKSTFYHKKQEMSTPLFTPKFDHYNKHNSDPNSYSSSDSSDSDDDDEDYIGKSKNNNKTNAQNDICFLKRYIFKEGTFKLTDNNIPIDTYTKEEIQEGKENNESDDHRRQSHNNQTNYNNIENHILSHVERKMMTHSYEYITFGCQNALLNPYNHNYANCCFCHFTLKSRSDKTSLNDDILTNSKDFKDNFGRALPNFMYSNYLSLLLKENESIKNEINGINHYLININTVYIPTYVSLYRDESFFMHKDVLSRILEQIDKCENSFNVSSGFFYVASMTNEHNLSLTKQMFQFPHMTKQESTLLNSYKGTPNTDFNIGKILLFNKHPNVDNDKNSDDDKNNNNSTTNADAFKGFFQNNAVKIYKNGIDLFGFFSIDENGLLQRLFASKRYFTKIIAYTTPLSLYDILIRRVFYFVSIYKIGKSDNDFLITNIDDKNDQQSHLYKLQMLYKIISKLSNGIIFNNCLSHHVAKKKLRCELIDNFDKSLNKTKNISDKIIHKTVIHNDNCTYIVNNAYDNGQYNNSSIITDLDVKKGIHFNVIKTTNGVDHEIKLNEEEWDLLGKDPLYYIRDRMKGFIQTSSNHNNNNNNNNSSSSLSIFLDEKDSIFFRSAAYTEKLTSISPYLNQTETSILHYEESLWKHKNGEISDQSHNGIPSRNRNNQEHNNDIDIVDEWNHGNKIYLTTNNTEEINSHMSNMIITNNQEERSLVIQRMRKYDVNDKHVIDFIIRRSNDILSNKSKQTNSINGLNTNEIKNTQFDHSINIMTGVYINKD